MAQVLGELDRASKDLWRLVGRLSEDQLVWRPNPAVWSVAETLAHLHIVGDLHRRRIEHAVAKASRGAGPAKDIRHTVRGRLMIRSVGPGSRTPVPRAFVPPPDADVQYRRKLMEQLQNYRLLAQSAAGVDWNAVRFRPPVAGFVRLNLADWFRVMLAHIEHHLRQIETLRERPDFPKC